MTKLRVTLLFLAAFALGYAWVTYLRVPNYVPDWPETAGV